jgi:cell division transport system permease protein
MTRPRPLYTAGRALRSLRGSPLPAFVTAATIAVALFLFGALMLTGENLTRMLLGWAGRADHVTVYASRGLGRAAVDRLAAEIAAAPEVARVRTIPPEEGLRDLRDSLGDAAPILEGVEPHGVLPPVVSVSLRTGDLAPESLRALTNRLGRLPGVDAVESEALWLERYTRLERVGAWIAIGWGVILALGSLLVVGNATRLAAFTRREEIEVLRLVGASEAFVVIPFLIEGAMEGLAGSLMGIGALAIVFRGLVELARGDAATLPLLAEVRFLDPVTLAVLAASGPVVGALGAAGSARRFVRSVAP